MEDRWTPVSSLAAVSSVDVPGDPSAPRAPCGQLALSGCPWGPQFRPVRASVPPLRQGPGPGTPWGLSSCGRAGPRPVSTGPNVQAPPEPLAVTPRNPAWTRLCPDPRWAAAPHTPHPCTCHMPPPGPGWGTPVFVLGTLDATSGEAGAGQHPGRTPSSCPGQAGNSARRRLAPGLCAPTCSGSRARPGRFIYFLH